jgi:hypothetical protein
MPASPATGRSAMKCPDHMSAAVVEARIVWITANVPIKDRLTEGR